MTLAYVAVASIAAISASISAASAIDQGQKARTQANMTADAQKNTAQSVEEQGAQAAADQKLKARKMEATQAATAGAGGVDPVTGTPLKIEGETAQFGELDSLRIINNAQRSAWGYQQQADITEFGGEAKRDASTLSAASTLLGGASNAYFGYKSMGKK
jgi:hypothetical protein